MRPPPPPLFICVFFFQFHEVTINHNYSTRRACRLFDSGKYKIVEPSSLFFYFFFFPADESGARVSIDPVKLQYRRRSDDPRPPHGRTILYAESSAMFDDTAGFFFTAERENEEFAIDELFASPLSVKPREYCFFHHSCGRAR